MGGSAFATIGPFPRLSRALYTVLKARHTASLGTVYTQVCTPLEAPEKQDHGDIDFLVYSPENLPSHDTVKELLGAAHVMPMPGPRTSNYAIPIPEDEFNTQMHVGWYQVDVHVCGSPEEFAGVRFFHSYGDMGMILGLVARHSGLHLGIHGLKVHVFARFVTSTCLIPAYSTQIPRIQASCYQPTLTQSLTSSGAI